MRNIINISLPKELSQIVDQSVSEGRYATKSEFFRDLLRMWIEGRLLQNLNESRKEIANGGGKILKSLESLR